MNHYLFIKLVYQNKIQDYKKVFKLKWYFDVLEVDKKNRESKPILEQDK